MGAPYATAQDLKDTGLPPVALQGLSDPDIDAALLRASGFVDSYMGMRFKLPLAAFGEDIKQCAIEIAAYYLTRKRGFMPGGGEKDEFRQAFEDQKAWLKDVQAGRATPAFPDTLENGSLDPTLNEGSFANQKSGGGISLNADPDLVITPPSSRGW